jgi:hypothetical protein
MKSKPRDDMGLTIVSDEGSQENILHDGRNETVTSPTPGKRGFGSKSQIPKKGITRTDIVTISYENDSEMKKDHVQPWTGSGP